jgi:hypothetical protein
MVHLFRYMEIKLTPFFNWKEIKEWSIFNIFRRIISLCKKKRASQKYEYILSKQRQNLKDALLGIALATLCCEDIDNGNMLPRLSGYSHFNAVVTYYNSKETILIDKQRAIDKYIEKVILYDENSKMIFLETIFEAFDNYKMRSDTDDEVIEMDEIEIDMDENEIEIDNENIKNKIYTILPYKYTVPNKSIKHIKTK